MSASSIQYLLFKVAGLHFNSLILMISRFALIMSNEVYTTAWYENLTMQAVLILRSLPHEMYVRKHKDSYWKGLGDKLKGSTKDGERKGDEKKNKKMIKG